MPIMPTRVNRVPRLGQPASYATPDSQTYGYDAGLPPSPSGSIPSLSNSHQSRGIPQGDAFGLMPGRTGSRARNFPAIGTGVLAGSNGVRNQGSLNAGQGVTAVPTQQPSYVSRPADNPFPYEHDYGTGNSQQFDVSMQNLRDRQRAANSLLQRNIGASGYGGIGGMTQDAYDQQSATINPLIAAHRQQQAQNNYTQWDKDRLRLAMAPRVEELPPLAPGLIGQDGQRVAPPPMSQYKGLGVGGTPVSESTQRASNIAARRRLADQQRIARRSSLMTGRPIQAKFRPADPTTQTMGTAAPTGPVPIRTPQFNGSVQMVPNPQYYRDPFGMPAMPPGPNVRFNQPGPMQPGRGYFH